MQIYENLSAIVSYEETHIQFGECYSTNFTFITWRLV